MVSKLFNFRMAVAAGVCWMAATTAAHSLQAATFRFGLDANDLRGVPTAELGSAGVVMQLAAGPPGSTLWETGSSLGLGVDSRDVLGPGGQFRFDRISGISEYIEFSFDQEGMLTGLSFEGVKDESLEYFLLETDGKRFNFFDSAANITIPGAIDNALALEALSGTVIYLLETDLYNDEVIDLSIPFSAGQVFRLTYMELGGGLGPLYEPIGTPNGARLQSITVSAVPEPRAEILMAAAAVLGCLWFCTSTRRGGSGQSPATRAELVISRAVSLRAGRAEIRSVCGSPPRSGEHSPFEGTQHR